MQNVQKWLQENPLIEHDLVQGSPEWHAFRDEHDGSSEAAAMLGAPALRLLIEAFPKAKIVAVGKKSDELLRNMGIVPVAAVRHPANGGATLFAAGMKDLM